MKEKLTSSTHDDIIEKQKSTKNLRKEKQIVEESLRVAQGKLESLALEIEEGQRRAKSIEKQLKAVGSKPKRTTNAKDRVGNTINLGDKIEILTRGKSNVTTSRVQSIRERTVTFKTDAGSKDWRLHKNIKVISKK